LQIRKVISKSIIFKINTIQAKCIYWNSIRSRWNYFK